MSHFIHSLKQKILLFDSLKSPHKMGDVIEVKKKLYLVIGIENFKIYGRELTIWYTVQDLEEYDFISVKPKHSTCQLEKLSVLYEYDDQRFEDLQPGRTVPHGGKQYKIIEHLHIAVNGAKIKLQFLASPIVPVDRKQVRLKYFTEKRKQLKIGLLDLYKTVEGE
ncbi:LacI family transcriptional regulator [Bacillus pseudomycoides]|uniref:LacI family transcriptional regulator n=1 Tax=Bacillus pseudomycoides TaxID=64104 RepID=A0ABD6TDE0_9BACI|nr:LacI family transcriptional regulator [Bacillus pseudomycoides]PHF04244.1 LacI family transcriptional regulator [Bacillus pseudomycoides]